MDEVNPEFPRTDVTLVIGANDVTNPAAKNEPGSPIYGMPILEVDQSKSVVVLKRSMASGFAGIDNPLFYEPKTSMLFGDAKQSVSDDHRRDRGAVRIRVAPTPTSKRGIMDPNRLTAIPIFSDLGPDEAKRLATFATETSVAEGQILMKQGDYSTELIAIEEGTADVIRDGVKIASLAPGDLIGEMGLLERQPRNADVIATSPMRVIKLTHWEIRRMSQQTVDRIRPDHRGAAPGGARRPRATRAATAPRSSHLAGWRGRTLKICSQRPIFLVRSARRIPGCRPGERGTQVVGASLAVIREMRLLDQALARQLTPQAPGTFCNTAPAGSFGCAFSAAFETQGCANLNRLGESGGTPPNVAMRCIAGA